MRWRRIATIFLFFGKFEGNFDFPANPGKIKYSPTANVILTVLETERQREEDKKKKS